ncbi:hypothetical protein T07_3996 [Trichinella nelsoni]|uniref:Uncharacterized protein n=1 Tax=Trichinella nelsoni TaxID=6336 RepID=A0A0V0SIT5_9BILA|nr:hypothetical protein T07_3996 [Trichinella nelsoni]
MENVSHCKRMKAIFASMIYIYHLHIIGIYIINLLLVTMIKFHFDIINIFLNYSNMKKNLKKRELSYQLLIITKHNKADDVQMLLQRKSFSSGCPLPREKFQRQSALCVCRMSALDG